MAHQTKRDRKLQQREQNQQSVRRWRAAYGVLMIFATVVALYVFRSQFHAAVMQKGPWTYVLVHAVVFALAADSLKRGIQLLRGKPAFFAHRLR